MLAQFVLPFQITASIFVVVWIVAVWRLQKRIAFITVSLLLLFIPACTGIKSIVDAFRYGRFEYASALDVPADGYIKLPPSATQIVLYRDGAGHRARFSISTELLRTWIDEQRALRPDLNSSPNDQEWEIKPDAKAVGAIDLSDHLELVQQLFRQRFPDTNWTFDPAMIHVTVTRSDRGGGFSVWHVPATGETYLSAGYW